MNTRITRNTRPLQQQDRNADLRKIVPPGGNKRPLEENDGNQKSKKKRVFGDITNKENGNVNNLKKAVKKDNTALKKPKTKTTIAVQKAKKVPKPKEEDTVISSQTSTKSEDVSWEILEISRDSSTSSSQNSNSEDDVAMLNQVNLVLSQEAKKHLENSSELLDDVDKEHMKDPFQAALYAPFIFNYYKEREVQFDLSDYISWQTDLTPHMRAILVDWLVEVQENFELNHETLYLAVKLVDLYLNKEKVSKEKLQLVGATALFIACKFDERCPPVLDDFLYICDDAYKREELIAMEATLLRSVDFDLGIPLSYRFLRRYAKCARASIVTLTLARYILETSQMDYNFVRQRDSLRAAACLLLAMKMDATGHWTHTLVHYTGYTDKDLMPLVRELNSMVASNTTSKLSTIRIKYTHRVFHEVAKIPALDVLEFHESMDVQSTSPCSRS